MRLQVREGLVLRTRAPEEAGEAYEAIDKNREYLRQWLPWVDGTDSPAVIEGVMQEWQRQLDQGTDLVLGIYEQERYVGVIGLHDIRRSKGSATIGYWLVPQAQGRGIMADCVRALVDFAFYTLMLNRVAIHCASTNVKSRAIPQKLGFALEGVLQDGECLYGKYFDLALYGMVERSWRPQPGGAMQLMSPLPLHRYGVMDYKGEFNLHGENSLYGSGGLSHCEDYDRWLENVKLAQQEGAEGKVAATTFLAVDGGRIVGTVNIRHGLNEELLKRGGHIGYSVRPTQRRKGYGKKILKLALEHCGRLGISQALITCDLENVASARTILACGGVLESEHVEQSGNTIQRYWISL